MAEHFGRRLGRLLWRWGPPIGLVVWAVNVYRAVNEYALPAFGTVDGYVADYRLTLLRHVPVGIALLCLSAVSLLRSRALSFKDQHRRRKEIYRRKNSARSM